MVEFLRSFLAILFILAGTLFSFAGVLGYIRLPDLYTRLHATGKVSVFGVTLLLLGASLLTPQGLGKALVLMVFLAFAGPAASHALASAAYRSGMPPLKIRRNDLQLRFYISLQQSDGDSPAEDV